MKAVGGLMAQIADFDNVSEAAWRAALGKRDRRCVGEFFYDFENRVADIVESIQTLQIQFLPYETFVVRDPKIRTIHAPAFRDRVIHHAIINVTRQVFESGATDRSYACRRGKGQHACIRRALGWLNRRDWFLKLDVSKFYDSIPHRILLPHLARRFREKSLLRLWEKLMVSYQTAPATGLPIGALTSQYLGNFFLDPIDHAVLQTGRMPRYLRYMDDMLMIGNRDDLLATRDIVAGELAKRNLEIKGGGIINRCSEGLPFLGFTLYPDRIRLDPRGRRRLRRKWTLLERNFLRARIGESELAAHTICLFAHAQTADDLAWRRAILRFTRLGDGLETLEPGSARRFLEQFRDELPQRLPQQEQCGQSQQELRFSGCFVSRHGDESAENAIEMPPDDARSRAPGPRCGNPGDKTARKSSPDVDIRPNGEETGRGGQVFQD